MTLTDFVASRDSDLARIQVVRGPLGLSSRDVNEWYGDDLDHVHVGRSRGEDYMRGAYEWWPLMVGRCCVGELIEGGCGLAVRVTDEQADVLAT